MIDATQSPSAGTAFPRVLRYCRCCERETPHEIHTAHAMDITECICCMQRALMYELGRD
jgi:hypothetical protein